MAVLGESGKPGYSYQAYDGTTNPNQMVEKLTAPQKIRIIELGAWIGGWNQVSEVVLAVYHLDGTLLGRTAPFNIANEGAAGDGQASLYTRSLITPVILESGQQFYVGTNRERSGNGVIWLTGTTVNPHYEARAAYPDGVLGGVEAASSVARRIGAYVSNYEPVASAKVYRSGAWTQAESVKVYRGGAWTDADGVKVYRSGAWVDVS